MISSKIKTLVGSILGLSLVVPTAIIFSNGQVFSKLQAQTDYVCAGNVRLEPNGDGTYTITHIGAGATTVDISSDILTHYKVTTINADAFDDCRDTLTSITIDANIPIEDGAFNNMTNELDVTFTGDMTEINYGHIFENTTIGTMTIPASVTTVSEETFYGIKDTTTLVYDGSFDTFYNSIFHSLWNAFKTTMSKTKNASVPTNIEVDGINYFIPDDYTITYGNGFNRKKETVEFLTTTSVYYFTWQPEGGTMKTRGEKNLINSELSSKCSFGVNNNYYYNNTGTKALASVETSMK